MEIKKIVKSKIIEFQYQEERKLTQEQSEMEIKFNTYNNALSIPHYLKFEKNILYYRARLEITLESDNSHTKHFESNEEMFEFIKDNLNDLETITL